MYKIKDSVDLRELKKFGFTITENYWEDIGEDCFEAVKETKNGKIVIHDRRILGYFVETDYCYAYLPVKDEDVKDLINNNLLEN